MVCWDMVQGGMVQGGMVQGGMVQGDMVQGDMVQGGMIQPSSWKPWKPTAARVCGFGGHPDNIFMTSTCFGGPGSDPDWLLANDGTVLPHVTVIGLVHRLHYGTHFPEESRRA